MAGRRPNSRLTGRRGHDGRELARSRHSLAPPSRHTVVHALIRCAPAAHNVLRGCPCSRMLWCARPSAAPPPSPPLAPLPASYRGRRYASSNHSRVPALGCVVVSWRSLSCGGGHGRFRRAAGDWRVRHHRQARGGVEQLRTSAWSVARAAENSSIDYCWFEMTADKKQGARSAARCFKLVTPRSLGLPPQGEAAIMPSWQHYRREPAEAPAAGTHNDKPTKGSTRAHTAMRGVDRGGECVKPHSPWRIFMLHSVACAPRRRSSPPPVCSPLSPLPPHIAPIPPYVIIAPSLSLANYCNQNNTPTKHTNRTTPA